MFEKSVSISAGVMSGEDNDVVYEANFALASFRYPPPPPIHAVAENAPLCPLVDGDEKV